MHSSGGGAFKVTYTDHRKAYVPQSSSTPDYASQVYLSYLCLMPDEEGEGETATAAAAADTQSSTQQQAVVNLGYDSVVTPEKMKFLKDERRAVLQQFAKLSGREQVYWYSH